MLWAMIAVGVIVLIAAFLAWAGVTWGKNLRAIASMLKRNYSGRHEYRTVAEDQLDTEFGHLDLGYYTDTTRLLEDKGFRRGVDIENLTVRASDGDPRVFLRMMTGGEGTMAATVYHFVRPGTPGAKVIDVETELSDGTFLITSNASAAGAMTSPPAILSEFMDAGTPPLDILARHEQRVRQYLSEHPEVRAVMLQSTEDAIELQHRMQDAKVLHRQSLDWITPEEISRMLNVKREMAGQTAEQIRRRIHEMTGQDAIEEIKRRIEEQSP